MKRWAGGKKDEEDQETLVSFFWCNRWSCLLPYASKVQSRGPGERMLWTVWDPGLGLSTRATCCLGTTFQQVGLDLHGTYLSVRGPKRIR